MRAPLPRRIAWFAPWTWKLGHWILAFLLVPPLYLLLVIVAEQSTINEPKNSWLRSVVNIIRAPLEPLRRPFRRTATFDIAKRYPDCEVCAEPAVVYLWEGVMVGDLQMIQTRPFCVQHHREYLDGPADAMKPNWPLSGELD